MADFNPDTYLAEKTGGAGFDPDKYLAEKEGSGIGGYLKETAGNVWPDIKDTGKGLLNLGKGLVTHPIDTISAIPGGLKKEAERIGLPELGGVGGHDPSEFLPKVAGAFKDKPVSTALDAATLFGLVPGETKAAEVAPIAEATETASKVAPAVEKLAPMAEDLNRVAPKAPEPVNLPPEASDILKEQPKVEAPQQPPPEPPPVTPPPKPEAAAPGIPFGDKLNEAATEATAKAKEVKDYISRGYEGFTKKPGNIANVADYVQEKSQMMAAQQMGATPLQARQVGHEGMRAIGQYALDNGIVDPATGLKGMRARNTELLKNSGNKIAELRAEADKVSQGYKPGELLQNVKTKLDPKYMRGVTEESPTPRGVYGGEHGSYSKALQEIEDAEGTHSGIADASTKLNHAANEAHRLNQPHGAFTDVANSVSEVNNARIKQLLGPQKALEYDQALKEYGVNKKISEFLKRKEAGEVKRFGPGSVMSNLTQKAMDEFGYKVGAKVGNKVSTSILKNPSIAKSLPSLFKEFINQVEETGHDITGMSEGGVVPSPMADFVNSRRSQ